MNYIKLINAFWHVQDENNLCVTDIAVYFYLVKISNRPGIWVNPFKRINSKIVADLGISKPTLSASRNRLKQVGLITFKTINGDANVEYKIIDLESIFAGTDAGRLAGNNIAAVLGSDTSPVGGDYVDNINIKESKQKENIYRSFAHLAITEAEFTELLLTWSKTEADDILDAIKNYKHNERYTSLFDTAKAWLKKNSAKKVSPVAGGNDSLAKKENKKRNEKALSAFDVYKQKGSVKDWDNLVWDHLQKTGVLPFGDDQNYKFLTQAAKEADRYPDKLHEDPGLVADAKQIALNAFFCQLAEESRELKVLLK